MSVKKPNSFIKYSTVDLSNEGVQMFIKDASGKVTTDWITVLGVDSDAFQTASLKMRGAMLRYFEEKGDTEKDDEAHSKLVAENKRRMEISCVKAWSFDEPCTPENVADFFRHAPYIATQVDEHASKRALFVKV